jgi:hypothetical protein
LKSVDSVSYNPIVDEKIRHKIAYGLLCSVVHRLYKGILYL